jgi:hypothetical protein
MPCYICNLEPNFGYFPLISFCHSGGRYNTLKRILLNSEGTICRARRCFTLSFLLSAFIPLVAFGTGGFRVMKRFAGAGFRLATGTTDGSVGRGLFGGF